MNARRFQRPWFTRGSLVALSALLIAGCSPEAPEDELGSADEAVTTASSSISYAPTFYTARGDTRTCAAPLCGGFWISAVNVGSTVCADGTTQSECYVAGIDFSLILSTSDAARLSKIIRARTAGPTVLLQGRLETQVVGGSTVGQLYVTQQWRAPSAVSLSGTFFGLAPTGIVCVKAPCPVIQETVLNTATQRTADQVDLSNVPGGVNPRTSAMLALRYGRGLIAVGTNVGGGGTSTSATASGAITLQAVQYYRLVAAAPDPCASMTCSPGTQCKRVVLECGSSPCPAQARCVAIPIPCGGPSGLDCPGYGRCVDGVSGNVCSGADCTGICTCAPLAHCEVGSWNHSPSICDCVGDGPSYPDR